VGWRTIRIRTCIDFLPLRERPVHPARVRVRLPVADPVAQNTSAPLDLTERRIAIGLHCWSSRPAHRAASSQELRRRRPAPALRPPHLRGPFLLSCCTSSARAGRCCPAPCSPSQPGLGVPDSRRTAGARVSAENRCGQGAGRFAVFVSLISFSGLPQI